MKLNFIHNNKNTGVGSDGDYYRRMQLNYLPSGEKIYWTGCPEVSEQVMEAVKVGTIEIVSIWVTPTPTEITSDIRQIVEVAVQVYNMEENLKLKQKVTAVEIREVLDGYEDVKDDDHVSIAVSW